MENETLRRAQKNYLEREMEETGITDLLAQLAHVLEELQIVLKHTHFFKDTYESEEFIEQMDSSMKHFEETAKSVAEWILKKEVIAMLEDCNGSTDISFTEEKTWQRKEFMENLYTLRSLLIDWTEMSPTLAPDLLEVLDRVDSILYKNEDALRFVSPSSVSEIDVQNWKDGKATWPMGPKSLMESFEKIDEIK